MCTTCGCGTGETRVAGRVVPGQEEVQQAARGTRRRGQRRWAVAALSVV
jgi:hypothetical protein